MRNPELIAFGFDEPAAASLATWAAPRGIRVRPVQKTDACLNLLREGYARAAILRVGRDLPSELELLAAVTAGFPSVASIVIEDSNHAELRATLWDIGARLVASPRQHAEVMQTLERVFA
ncbi:MAG: hypothetical protein K2X38_18985 [Gemmataceae bacterium]|nr:hypothetical protein [Gemmataceae bacterium]